MPDTTLYYHIAYAVAAAIYLLYVLGLYRRSRRVRRRLARRKGGGR